MIRWHASRAERPSGSTNEVHNLLATDRCPRRRPILTCIGTDWLQQLTLNLRKINAVSKHAERSVEYLVDKYGELFLDELGTIKSFQAELRVELQDRPKSFKARSVPYALRLPIEEELDRLEREGIIDKVTHSEWATPVVAMPKPDGRVRLCGDFKVTVNPSMKVDQYPLPKVDDLLAMLAGGKQFTKLDLTQAYLQLTLHQDSKEYCTINTHRGLYRFNRLPFGIASAPALFQKTMDTILQVAPGAMCYIDDIFVTGPTNKAHLQNLEKVFRRLKSYGIRMKKEKCHFMRNSVTYLGHVIDSESIHATPDKIKAIVEAPIPTNVRNTLHKHKYLENGTLSRLLTFAIVFYD